MVSETIPEEGTFNQVPSLESPYIEKWIEKETVFVTWGGSLPATGAAGGINIAAKAIFESRGIPVHFIGSSAANFANWMIQIGNHTDPQKLVQMLTGFELSKLVSLRNFIRTGNVLPQGILEKVFKEYVANIPRNRGGSFKVITTIVSDTEKFPFIASVEKDEDKNFLLLELTCAIERLINSQVVQQALYEGLSPMLPYPKSETWRMADGDLNNPEAVIDLIRYKYPNALIINCFVNNQNPLMRFIGPGKFNQQAEVNISVSSALAPIKPPLVPRSVRAAKLRSLFEAAHKDSLQYFMYLLQRDPNNIANEHFLIEPKY